MWQTSAGKALNLLLLPQATNDAKVCQVLCEVDIQGHLWLLQRSSHSYVFTYVLIENYLERRFSKQIGNVRNSHQFVDQLMNAEPNFGNDGK